MLDLKLIQENFEEVKKKLASRGQPQAVADVEEAYYLSAEIKGLIREAQAGREKRNRISEEVKKLKMAGGDVSALIEESRQVGETIAAIEKKSKELEERLKYILLRLPNIPHDSVPVGKTTEDNVVVRVVGQPPVFDFEPLPHWDIGTNLGILDFERAAKITGSRFALYFGPGARLERALINFMLDLHTKEKGFKEVLPPFIANEASLMGTGNLPKFAEDLFKLEGFDWYLIPTAEVPLTNIYRGEILEGGKLPERLVAYTPCFRSEAGSYGKDIRGLVRQHQFNKVEMMIFSLPEKSLEELEYMTSCAGEVLERLGLAYRVVALCTGDMGFASGKTYDLEVWMPTRNGYMEISSCSDCFDFQARRAQIKFKRDQKVRPEFVHTLNGSGLAVGRTVSAILENYQQKDGSVVIPEALRPYLDGLEAITG
ncbi:MAG TPA: serine--tRNA ligase [Candidatus Saccharicenans sp.]|jgi:seryl-tRNA synthetase|nr:serine--tRNA ligase [Candidatus Saccharicenans sp.]HRD02311.1 serine--tRNA ligase [Candidatus Saccharicenans sp.]